MAQLASYHDDFDVPPPQAENFAKHGPRLSASGWPHPVKSFSRGDDQFMTSCMFIGREITWVLSFYYRFLRMLHHTPPVRKYTGEWRRSTQCSEKETNLGFGSGATCLLVAAAGQCVHSPALVNFSTHLDEILHNQSGSPKLERRRQRAQSCFWSALKTAVISACMKPLGNNRLRQR